MAVHGIWKWMLEVTQNWMGAAPYGIWGEHCSCWWGSEEDAVDPCGT